MILSSCGNDTIGKYKKSKLPEGFHYSIIRDKSNTVKNDLHLSINQKITVEQIATIASELYTSKPKRDTFYIYYHYFLNIQPAKPWATSNFTPELEIKIHEK